MSLFYEDQFVRLYHTDCYSLLSQFDLIFDAIITDPPYAINYNNHLWDSEDFTLCGYGELFYNLLKQNGNLLLFQGWSNVINTILDFKNFQLKNWIIWDRIKGRGAKTNFVSTRQDILWFVKNLKSYTFNPQHSKIKKKTGGSIGTKNGCQFRKLSNVWCDISPIVPWSSQRVQHPTQKPLQLMERIVRIFTNQGDVVLDPFGGSGTTAIACKKLKRKCIIIQKQLQYCEIIKKRLNKDS